jgi:multicomponent Na+:H+ antiporter subunit D
MSAVYLIVVPLLVAFISILSKKAAPYLLVLVSFLSVVGVYFLEPGTIMIGGFAAPYGISLVVTNFAIAGLYIVNILFFLVVTISLNEYKKLASILLVALAGLNGLLLTGDLFNLFVFLEISGIAAYLITTTNKKPLATFSYLVLGTVGSSMYLLGLIILYNMFGTLNMADMAAQIDASGVDAVVVSFPFLLMFIGLGVEAKLLPFNSWVKGILNSANKLSGPMIAAVYAAAMGLLFGKLLNQVFVLDATLALIVTVVLIFSIVAGEAMAYASMKAKEILLFSSIAQAALAVLVFFNGFVELGLVMIGANAFAKLVLFVVITHAEKQTGSDEVDSLRGLFANNKLVGAGFTAATLSVLGLPLFVGFVIKLNILVEFFNNSSYLFPAVILLSSVVEGVYFIKLLVKLWNPKGKESTVTFDYVIIYVSLVVALVLVFLGTFSGELVNILDFVGGVQ